MSRMISIQNGGHTYAFRFDPENEGVLLNLLSDAEYCSRIGLSDSDVDELRRQIATGQSYPPSLSPPPSAPSVGAFVAVPFFGPWQPNPMTMQGLYAMAWQAAQSANQADQSQSEPGFLPPSDRLTRWPL